MKVNKENITKLLKKILLQLNNESKYYKIIKK